jgi:hypothetical protein
MQQVKTYEISCEACNRLLFTFEVNGDVKKVLHENETAWLDKRSCKIKVSSCSVCWKPGRAAGYREDEKVKRYKFKNPRFFSKKPLSSLLGIILLTPLGEAKQIFSSQVFIGTVEDTAGASFAEVMKQGAKIAIAHPQTKSLFNEAASGLPAAKKRIIDTGIEACLEKTKGIFPPQPVNEHFYHVGAMPANEITGSCFIIITVYKEK